MMLSQQDIAKWKYITGTVKPVLNSHTREAQKVAA